MLLTLNELLRIGEIFPNGHMKNQKSIFLINFPFAQTEIP